MIQNFDQNPRRRKIRPNGAINYVTNWLAHNANQFRLCLQRGILILKNPETKDCCFFYVVAFLITTNVSIHHWPRLEKT